MRIFRLMAIGVLLLVLVGSILGTACAGARGEQGLQGDTGATGPVGATGATGATGPQGLQGEKGDTGLPGAGVAWKGEWSNATAYSLNDAVGYQGSSYVSRQNDNTNHVPTDTTWWDLWVEKGDTGAAGTDGAAGAAGADGQDGAPGPNMIVAMGSINSDGTILDAWNVTSVTWTEFGGYYDIVLTGITYSSSNYVTLATPISAIRYIRTYSSSGHLRVGINNNLGEVAPTNFHFVVLDPDLA